MKIIRGSFDQSDSNRFPKYFGRQCTANAVTACCKAFLVHPDSWTSITIDECLISGDKLFELSYIYLPQQYNQIPFLRVEELQPKVTFANGTEVRIDKQNYKIAT